MKKVINAAARTVTFVFDGYKDKDGVMLDAGLAPMVFYAAKMSTANRAYAELHGMAARIGDAAALTKSAENGFRVTEAMRRKEIAGMVEFYENPDNVEWNQRVATGTKAAPLNPAIAAIAAKLGKTYEEAMAWYNEKLMKELAELGA